VLPAEGKVPQVAAPLYLLPEAPPLRELCRSQVQAPDPGAYKKSSIYTFESIVLSPVPGGPRSSRQPRAGVVRDLGDLVEALDERGADLRSCYSWAASQQPDLAGELTVHLVINPLGQSESVAVTATAAQGAALAQCIQESLADLQLESPTCRRTSATLRLLLAGEPQAPRSHLRKRPLFLPPDRRRSPRLCVRCPVEIPTDELVAAGPVLQLPQLSDPDDLADEEQYQEAVRTWSGQGPRPARRPILTMRPRAAKVLPSLSGKYATSAVQANLGTYRQCYREALQRTPGLTGQLGFALELKDRGEPSEVRLTASTVQEPILLQCLSAALAEVYIEPAVVLWRTRLEVSFELRPEFPLPLGPETQTALPLQVEAQAEQWLSLEAGEPALRHYSALLRYVPTHPRACYFYLGALRAVLLEEPWAGQATLAALAALARYTQQNPNDPAVPQCLAAAAPVLTSLSRLPAALAGTSGLPGLRERAVAWYRLLVDFSPPLPNAAHLRLELAEVLLGLYRYAEAAGEYRRVVAIDPASPLGQQAAQQLAVVEQQAALPPPLASVPTRVTDARPVHRVFPPAQGAGRGRGFPR
jgi:tetratricopeptide (TPR) repeat protein